MNKIKKLVVGYEELITKAKELEIREKKFKNNIFLYHLLLKFIGVLASIALVCIVYVLIHTGGIKLLLVVLFAPLLHFFIFLKDILF